MNELKGRVVLITGGGTGMGAAVAKRFAKEGAKVMIAGRRKEPLDKMVQQIKNENGTADFITADVSKWDDCEKIVQATIKKFGALTTVVTCAGVVKRTEKVEEATEQDWNWQIDINLKGTYAILHFALPELIKSGNGVIVATSSMNSHLAAPGYTTYAASKAGVSAVIRNIALQYASEGIRANTICPGLIHTPMSYVDRVVPFEKMVDKFIEQHYPIKRMGQPEDIANAALFLASDQSSWITGQELFVDGGYSIK